MDNRYIEFQFIKTNHNGVFLGDISQHIESAEIEFNQDRDIKAIATFRAKGDVPLNMIADHVMPRVRVQEGTGDFEEFTLGIYHLTWPREAHDAIRSQRDCTAYDMTVHLVNAKFDSVRTVDVGASPVEEAIAICKEADVYGVSFDRFNIPPTESVLAAGLTWEVGVEKIRAVSDLLQAVGYYSPWADEWGYLTSRPSESLASLTEAVTYETNPDGIVREPTELETDATRFANKIIVISNSPDLDTPIVATAVNDNPQSPISTVVLGQTITKVIERSVVDEATAQAVANQELEEAASVYVKGTLRTRLDFPRVGKAHEAYRIEVYRDGNTLLTGKWWCRGWSLPLAVGGVMQHTIARVEAV